MIRPGRAVVLAIPAALAVLLMLGLGASSMAVPASAPIHTDSSPVSATVYFNGNNVASHTSLGSAISTAFSGIFNTTFVWVSTGTPVYVTQGQVELLFFGAAIGTSSEQVAQGGHGTFTLKSDFSQNQYLFEGAYEMQASLLSNGTTVFTQDFYIWAQATDHLTVVNVALGLIGILEVYQIVALGSYKKAREQLGIPAQPPKTPPASGGS